MGSILSSDGQRGSPSSTGTGRKQKSGAKRKGTRASIDYKTEEILHQIPGRMFSNGSSPAASLFSQQGKKGVNQDAMIVWEVSISNICFLCL